MQNLQLDAPVQASQVRFGSFEVDRRRGEIRKRGMKMRLQEKPFQALLLLLNHPGEVVSREDLRQALWPDDEYGDFEHGVNLAINRLRSALGDRADSPRFVETLPRRGYRFIAPVEALGPGPETMPETPAAVRSDVVGDPPEAPALRSKRGVLGFRLFAALVLVVLVSLAYSMRPRLPVGTPPGRVTLVVLPFRDLGPQPAQYLSQGLTSEMIFCLGHVAPERLGVIAFTTALRYEETSSSIDQIARELGVQYIVEGSVTHTDEKVRINVQLIKARDQTQLLSESFESDMPDILALQRTVAESITASLAGDILGLEVSPPEKAEAAPEAYMAFLKGRFFWNQRTEEGLRRSIEEFERAIEIDPGYARAHAGLAEALALFPSYGLEMPLEAMPKARSAAIRALELEPTLAEAHAVLAWVRWAFEWDWKEARVSFLTALELDANNATVHQWYASLLTSLGDFDGARERMRRALELDPDSRIIRTGRAVVEFYARDFEKAVEQCLETLELDPSFEYANKLLAESYAQQGAYEEALGRLGRLLESESTPALRADLAYVRALSGDVRGATETLDSLVEATDPGGYVPPYRVALVHVALGQNAEALRWLEAALESRAFEMVLARVDPRLDPLRNDPGFQQLRRKVGF